ncbi:hypothetical protein K456DRAFT_97459 [Colletotrichum gloeosporioides 23]|nr:hypothetical protein K456DRAFT_97459 [Colletotrichum gloeosporioides 23]
MSASQDQGSQELGREEEQGGQRQTSVYLQLEEKSLTMVRYNGRDWSLGLCPSVPCSGRLVKPSHSHTSSRQRKECSPRLVRRARAWPGLGPGPPRPRLVPTCSKRTVFSWLHSPMWLRLMISSCASAAQYPRRRKGPSSAFLLSFISSFSHTLGGASLLLPLSILPKPSPQQAQPFQSLRLKLSSSTVPLLLYTPQPVPSRTSSPSRSRSY